MIQEIINSVFAKSEPLQIGQYLGWNDDEINRYIEEYGKQIELINRFRQAESTTHAFCEGSRLIFSCAATRAFSDPKILRAQAIWKIKAFERQKWQEASLLRSGWHRHQIKIRFGQS